jgi:CheY-like chemotaxis protein
MPKAYDAPKENPVRASGIRGIFRPPSRSGDVEAGDEAMKRKVLVVDDNIDSITILRSILETNGFAVRTAQSGLQALDLLSEEVPDVILLDVMMPEMSGLEVLERIKANHATSRLPVILVTAKMQDEDVLTGYQFGADYYITKPCTAKQLLYGIGLVLGKAEASAGPPQEKDELA